MPIALPCLLALLLATPADEPERRPTTMPVMDTDPAPAEPDGEVATVKNDPTYNVLAFDAADPPTVYEPDLERQAHTAWFFGQDAWYWYDTVRVDYVADDRVDVLVLVNKASVELWLHCDLHLPPDGGDEAAAAYEQARWELVEANYATADDAARRAMGRVVGRYFAGTGATADAAVDDAIATADAVFAELYYLGTVDRALAVELKLDEITDVGRSDRVTLEQAKTMAVLQAAFGEEQTAYEEHLGAPTLFD